MVTFPFYLFILSRTQLNLYVRIYVNRTDCIFHSPKTCDKICARRTNACCSCFKNISRKRTVYNTCIIIIMVRSHYRRYMHLYRVVVVEDHMRCEYIIILHANNSSRTTRARIIILFILLCIIFASP